MTNDKQFERILKECFWDSNYTRDDIIRILDKSDEKTRKLLFQKILFNSSSMLLDLSLFSVSEISEYLKSLKIGTFQKEYFEKRKKIAEIYFLNAPNTITELKWPA